MLGRRKLDNMLGMGAENVYKGMMRKKKVRELTLPHCGGARIGGASHCLPDQHEHYGDDAAGTACGYRVRWCHHVPC